MKPCYILIPCKNEEESIYNTVIHCQSALPDAIILVGNNLSTDNTKQRALDANARVIDCPIPGKGACLKTLLEHVPEDAIVGMIDGDDTYDAHAFIEMRNIIDKNPNAFVTAIREHEDPKAFPKGHVMGNIGLNLTAAIGFGKNCGDLLSGQRMFSKQFIKNFHSHEKDFRVETEITATAIQHCELYHVKTSYKARYTQGTSKLKTIPDGFRILGAIILYTACLRFHLPFPKK